MQLKIVNELIETTDKLVESEKQIKEDIDILVKTDQTILLLIKELQKQVVAYQEETIQLRDELQELYRIIKEISIDASIDTVDDLELYINSQSDKSMN